MQPARWPNLDPKRPYTTGYAFADARGFPEKGARFSPTGLYEDEIQIRPADARRWAHPEDAWVIAYPRHNWWNRVLDVTNVANGVVQVKARHAEIKDRLFPWDRWCVENMGEELDRPGEWYYDARAEGLPPSRQKESCGGRLPVRLNIPVNNSIFNRLIDGDGRFSGIILVNNSVLWYTVDKLIVEETDP